ncbi:unnamed protein product [Durusdinium trenchii]|uniref:3-hydroxyisobutyryl-coenzyme A hydrolase n=1 Tax=Durusdinium trenchii TaxID=1381693 RepID=A0ABP0QUG4_9DINO
MITRRPTLLPVLCLALMRGMPTATIYSGILGPLLGRSVLRPPPRTTRTPPAEPPPVPAEHPAEPAEDPHVRRLVENVETSRHPQSVAPSPSYDLLVLGAGVAGLISCIVGRQLGRSVALVEPHYMGGDCLNTGCVPSKALIAAAKEAHQSAPNTESAAAQFVAAMSRLRRIRAEISEHDSVQRYSTEVGVDVISSRARFASRREVVLEDGSKLQFRKCILGTGAAARIPKVLEGIPHLTNSNLWNLRALPPSLIVLGAGPIGLELAQALQRLGSQVTVVVGSSGKIMGKEEEAAADIVKKSMEADGVKFVSSKIQTITCSSNSESELYDEPFVTYRLKLVDDVVLDASALLNATGRVARTAGLDLEKAGIHGSAELEVNEWLQTSNEDVFAAGDCLPGAQRFTHAAEWQARVAVRNALLDERMDARRLLVPRATYTDPEVASVGSSAQELRDAGKDFTTFMRQAGDVDRNVCDGVSGGYASLHVAPDGEILGATVVGRNAGDHISEVTLCMQHGLTAAELAGTMHPYPTAAEVVRQAAQAFVRSRIFDAQNQETLKRNSEACDWVRSEWKNGLHIISLDRPKALNACNQAMAKCIAEAAARPASAVLLRGDGGRAFCAGGDVKGVALAIQADPQSSAGQVQVAHEYNAVAQLSAKREDGVPVICFMDGICMGFGLGLACAAEFRIVTETSLLAMPECNIGITPDVGFAATAASITPGVGKCMSLTGWRLTGKEAVTYGLATHFIPSERLPSVTEHLESIDWTSRKVREDVLELLQREAIPVESSGRPDIERILEEVFVPSSTAREAFRRLTRLYAEEEEEETQSWVQERLEGMGEGNCLCQEVIMRLLEMAEFSAKAGKTRHARLMEALSHDFASLSRLFGRPDFCEGVRAALIEKDKSPKWQNATLAEVDPAEVYRVLAPLPPAEALSFG